MSSATRFRSVLGAAILGLVLLPIGGLTAQEEPLLDWRPGPTSASIGGSLAEIDVPEEFAYALSSAIPVENNC